MSAPAPGPITFSGRKKAITQGMVLIKIDKALVVLTREEFVTSLKRGKVWRRWAALQARQPEIER